MKNILLILDLFLFNNCNAQNYNGLFIHAEYQILNYQYLQLGLGHSLKKPLINTVRKTEKYFFSGYSLSYTTNLNNSDWGLAGQYMLYSGSYSGPTALGLELNYKSIDHKNHYGIKPIVGLSFPMWSVTYGYNFDLYKQKDLRISQHEVVFGLRLRVLKWR